MKREVFRDLVACQSEQSIADYLQVSLRTVRRWKAGSADAPHSAVLDLLGPALALRPRRAAPGLARLGL